MSRLTAPTNALVQLLQAALDLTWHAPAQLQQSAHLRGAPEAPQIAGRIVWELLPPANAPPGADTGVQSCAPAFMHIRPTPSSCPGFCKYRFLPHGASAHTRQPGLTCAHVSSNLGRNRSEGSEVDSITPPFAALPQVSIFLEVP